MRIISKRRNFAGTKYAVDEAVEDNKFNDIPNVLRDVADNLEENEFSEDSRLSAIRTIMPLIGKMRAGISVNEEEEDVNESEAYDKARSIKNAYFKLQKMGMKFKNKDEFFKLKEKYPNSIKYLVALGQGKGDEEFLFDKIAELFNGSPDEDTDDDMIALNEEYGSKKKVKRRKVSE